MSRNTPVLRGNIYCSPGCGFNCTKAAFDRATAEAQALADTMGPGWGPCVWENCGWCYDVHKGSARVHPQRKGSAIRGVWEVLGYTVFLNFPGKQIITKAESAIEAHGLAMQDARTFVAHIQAGLDHITNEEVRR